MSEKLDLSALKSYLCGQMDMGESEVFLDEPWSMKKRAPAPALRAAAPSREAPSNYGRPADSLSRPSSAFPPSFTTNGPAAASAFAAPGTSPAMDLSSLGAPAVQNPVKTSGTSPEQASSGSMFDAPTPRPVRRVASAFESVTSLDAFYSSITSEPLYAQAPSLARYEGPEHPRLLLLLPQPQPETSGSFFTSPVGEMLSRLFMSLNVPTDSIGVTYFYKSPVARSLPPLLETALRKMLTKELSFVAPEVMVSFGETLFYQLFGKGRNFNDLAGTDQEFSGIKTCSLVDAAAMMKDKQLKWLTWKVHLPKSSYFTPA